MAEAIHEVGSRGDLTEADVASAPLLLSVLLMIFHEEIPKAGRAQRRKRVRIQDWLVHDELPFLRRPEWNQRIVFVCGGGARRIE